jgi:class 3 adenylate cyclase/tetratricopeptide (TPR) repeat protein
MMCPKCQFDNRLGAKFCKECGNKFELTCPQCENTYTPGAKFCDECGHGLQVQEKEAFPIACDPPQSYTPKHLADKVLTSQASIEGERKVVTVLFGDVANSTAIFERLDPEVVHRIMDGCFRILMDEIHRYGGTVNQFRGDCVMALFGAPLAHEDHAKRACFAALRIQRAMKAYSEDIRARFGIEFKMRIGLDSGLVMVGSIGNDLRMDYTADGDTSNLASRMESLAKPGTILVSGNTHNLAENYFKFESLGKIRIKGKETSQEAYILLSPSHIGTRFTSSVARGLTRFVGRKNSMPAIEGAYVRAQSGSGQIVGVVGGAGVGKSRFLLEFRNQLPQDEFVYLEGRCLHFGEATAYSPIVDILKSYFEIKDEDKEDLIGKKLEQRIPQHNDNLQNILTPLHDILSLEVNDEAYLSLNPVDRRGRIFEALRDLFVSISPNKSLILAVEDLHWIDKTSEEFLDYLIGQLANTRILLILLFRPEFTHPWGSISNYNRIGLAELNANSSTELIQAILERGEVVPELKELILFKAGGNPLFLEELTHDLLENGSIKQEDKKYILSRKAEDIEVPDTIQGIIASRIDRLDSNLKQTLQTASVIGRDFTFRILKKIRGIKDGVGTHLLELQDLEIIYEKTAFPELEFIFKHALIQEVAYGSLLLNRRKEIHKRIGQAIEGLYPGHLGDHSPMLALHFTRGDDSEKGYQYHHLAGDRAAASYANREAMEHFHEAWRLISDGQSDQKTLEKRMVTVTKLAEVMEPLGEFELALEFLQQVMEVSEGAEDSSRFDTIHYWMGNTLGNLGRYDDARSHLFRSLELSQESGNKETEGLGYSYLSQLDHVQGYFKRALSHAEESIRCFQNIMNPTRQAWVFVIKGLVLSYLKREDDYREFLEKAISQAENSGNDRARCFLLSNHCGILIYSGQYDAAIKISLDSLEEARRIDDGILTALFFTQAGQAALYAGRTDYALELLRQGESEGIKVSHPLAQSFTRTILADALLRAGKVEEALKSVEAALVFCQALDLGPILQNALQIKALILAHCDPFDETRIEEMMEQAAALAERGDSPWMKVSHHMARARIGLKLGRILVARNALAKARTLYLEMGLEKGTGELRSVERALE